MSSVTFGQKKFIPSPPDKGSFPLDHENICKVSMLKYMVCLQDNKNDNSLCRNEAKDYLECRMNNSLMAKEDWKYLGFEEKKDKQQ